MSQVQGNAPANSGSNTRSTNNTETNRRKFDTALNKARSSQTGPTNTKAANTQTSQNRAANQPANNNPPPPASQPNSRTKRGTTAQQQAPQTTRVELLGTNVEEGAAIRVTEGGKSRVIKDLNAADQQRRPQEPRDLDGQANGSISFDISNQGPTLIQVDNPRAPDFQFTLPANRLQTGFREGEILSLRPNSGPLDHAPHMSVGIGADENGSAAQLKINADLSQQQVDHYQTATNGNLNGHLGSGNVGLDSWQIAGQLVDGTASNSDVNRTLGAVETQRNIKTHAAADALADFMNTGLPILKNVPRPSSAGLDPAKAQSDLE